MSRGPRRRDLVVAATLILGAILVGGWSYRGLAGTPEPAPPVSTTTTSSVPTVTVPPDLGQLAAYIDEHFAETDWYPFIVRYQPLGPDGVAVVTSLAAAATDQGVAICRAASFWKPGDGLPILVLARSGRGLVESPSGDAEECKAT